MGRASAFAAMFTALLMAADVAQAQSRTPSQEQDEMAQGLLSRAERYCLSAADAEQSLGRARAEGFVSPPAALAAMMAQPGATDMRVLWKIAEAELWALAVGTIQRPEGAAEVCIVAAHPSVDDMLARTEAALGVGAPQTLAPQVSGFIFEQQPDGTRQAMAAGEAMKQLRGRKARSLRLVTVPDAAIAPGAKMTAVAVTRLR
jgi:hypothetical protein